MKFGFTKEEREQVHKACQSGAAATERLGEEVKTPEFKEKMAKLQEEWRKRNEGFAERGEDWRDIEIA